MLHETHLCKNPVSPFITLNHFLQISQDHIYWMHLSFSHWGCGQRRIASAARFKDFLSPTEHNWHHLIILNSDHSFTQAFIFPACGLTLSGIQGLGKSQVNICNIIFVYLYSFMVEWGQIGDWVLIPHSQACQWTSSVWEALGWQLLSKLQTFWLLM